MGDTPITPQDSGADQTSPTDSGQDSTTPTDSGSDAASDAPADVSSDAPADVAVTCDADAGQTLCSGTCVLTASNASHCGACNHDCLGGTCSAGMCQPVTLATLAHAAYRLATDGAYVVFGVNDTAANGGGVYNVSVNGTNQTPFTIFAVDNVSAVAIHSSTVYWVAAPSGTQTIEKGTAGTNGGTSTGKTLGPASSWTVEGIALNSTGTTLVYADTATGSSIGLVGSCPVSNFSSCAATSTLTENYPIGGVTTDDTNIYWSDVTAGRIQMTPINIGSTTNFVTNAQSSPGHILYDSGYVYWSSDGGGYIYRSPTTSPSQTQVATVNSPNGMAVDAKYVYISGGVGPIQYVPVTGGTPSDLAPANNSGEMTRDSKALYYFNYGDMTLRKVALPL